MRFLEIAMAYKLTVHLRDSPQKSGGTEFTGVGFAIESYHAVTIHVHGRGKLSFPWSNILSVENHGEEKSGEKTKETKIKIA